MENNRPKKKNAGLTALIALLLIITTIASGIGLYAWAKYISSRSGQATAAVAKWSFNVSLKKGQNTVVLGTEPLDLATTLDSEATHIANGKIAPGTSGTFDIEINTTGTEVDLQYDVEINLANCPRNITFSRKTGESGGQDVFTPISAGGASNAADLTRNGITFSEYVAYGNNGVHTERIKWDWPYDAGQNASAADQTAYDTRDNADENIINASESKKVTMNITVTGTEMLEDSNTVQAQAQAGNIHQWDSVNYDPGELTTDTIDLPAGASIRGSKFASINLPSGASLSNTISADEASDWVVLDVNEKTGEVKIIPRTYSSTELYLSGMDGYNNAVTKTVGGTTVLGALDRVAAIYLNPAFADSSRSLTVDDLNGAVGYTPPVNGGTYYWDSDYGMDADTLDIVKNGGDTYEISTESQGETITLEEKLFTSTDETSYYEYYDISFNGRTCWLASRFIDLTENLCWFGVRALQDNLFVGGNSMFQVNDNGVTSDVSSGKPVVPVVTLKSTVHMNKDSNNVWQLSL